MTSELVLLLVMSMMITTTAFNGIDGDGGIRGMLQNAGPKLSARMEKHLMTGHIFCKKSANQNLNAPCDW